MYDADFMARRPSIGDMSLSANGGITYQYYTGVLLWKFGRCAFDQRPQCLELTLSLTFHIDR